MLTTFNCGVGMIALADPADADAVAAALSSLEYPAVAVGKIEPVDGSREEDAMTVFHGTPVWDR